MIKIAYSILLIGSFIASITWSVQVMQYIDAPDSMYLLYTIAVVGFGVSTLLKDNP